MADDMMRLDLSPLITWTVLGSLPAPVAPGVEAVPWGYQQWVLGKIFTLADIDDLPGKAEEAEEFFRNNVRKSLLSLPLKICGRVEGALVFARLQTEICWPDELALRLRLITDIFANILHRKKSVLRLE